LRFMKTTGANLSNIILAAIAVGLLFKIGVIVALIVSLVIVLKVLK